MFKREHQSNGIRNIASVLVPSKIPAGKDPSKMLQTFMLENQMIKTNIISFLTVYGESREDYMVFDFHYQDYCCSSHCNHLSISKKQHKYQNMIKKSKSWT